MVVDTPWVTDSAGGAGGVEAGLAMELARGLNARPKWVHGPEAELMEALERRELDLVIGGVTGKLPWKSQVAFTKPYYTDTLTVGMAAGTPAPAALKGQRVAVEDRGPAASHVRSMGATPVPVADLAHPPAGLVAAPAWRLAALHLTGTQIVLAKEPHVFAAAPGENGFLMRVETLLRSRKAQVPALLRKAAR
jgi:polar amino acid transport system substrate-binding protein